jgi:actin related protein 2/3 complex, subunit 1A/1B
MVKKNKPHCSTILSCAWHPTDNLLLLTGCGDNKARFMTCYLKDTDPKDRKCEFPTVHSTQETTGWVHSVAWSPSGKTYAYTGHDSTLYVADSQSHEVVSVATTFNPFKKLLYLSETSIVAVGHDFTPVLFSSNEGQWKCYGKVEPRHKNTIKFLFFKFLTHKFNFSLCFKEWNCF